jgi:uroporphyrinogen decarboxylase
MNSRQRIHAAIHFLTPDRLPFDLGSTDVTGIHTSVYARLCHAAGLNETALLLDPLQGLAAPSLEFLSRLGVDTAGIWLNPTLQPRQELRVQDEWGTTWKMPEHGLWYEPEGYPLQGLSAADIGHYNWPDPTNPAKFQGLEERVQNLYMTTNLGLVANFSGALLARGQLLRGPAEFLMDLLENQKLAEEILDRVLEYNLALVEGYLKLVGKYIEVIKVSDDLGAQNNLLISPNLYRRLIKPRQARFFDAIHRQTRARLLYHTCGSVNPLIDDFIEIGVDILNPIQVGARGMDTAVLGEKYGGRLTFWGAVDNQKTISVGTPPQVVEEVQRRIHDLAAPGGGYVIASSHNIQPDTPVENILALAEASRAYSNGIL